MLVKQKNSGCNYNSVFRLYCMYCFSGSSTSAANSRHVTSPPVGAVVTNNYHNCSVNVQQGNSNVMEISPVVPQEPVDSEMSLQSDYSYEVVTEDTSGGELDEFDRETLRALGVVGRTDHSVTTPDQCSAADDDDETYEKQLAVSAGELDRSPETVCLSDDAGLQPSISRPEYNGTSHSCASPSDACSSSGTAADAAVSSSGYVGGSEFQLNAERVAEDDMLRKSVIVDVAVADDGEQVSASDNAELMVSDVTRWPEGHEIDSFHDTRTLAPQMTEDTSNTGGLINSDSSPPAALSDELKSDTCALPASEQLQQGPSVNSDSGDTASTDDCTTNCWLQSLRGAMIWAAQVGVHFYRNATV